MSILPLPRRARQGGCCGPAEAWAWTREVAAMALAGDEDARRALPAAVDHFLQAVRLGQATSLTELR